MIDPKNKEDGRSGYDYGRRKLKEVTSKMREGKPGCKVP